MSEKDPNINHVASLAGVSRATASRVFAGETLVAAATREKVLQAARMLHYRPNPLARALSGGKTRTVGILWSLGGNPIAPVITRLLSEQFWKRNYAVHVADTFGDPKIMEDILVDFKLRRFDGIVLNMPECEPPPAGFYLETLQRFRAVVLVTAQRSALGFDELVHDRTSACCAAADHLVETGKLHPAWLGNPGLSNRLKSEAFMGRCRQRGLAIDPAALLDLGRHLPLSEVFAFLETRFAGGAFPFDAVMCNNDGYAVALMAWLRRHGLHVPRDVAVIGFNDEDADPYLDPPLASVDARPNLLVNAIEHLIFSRLENPGLPPRREELAMRFVRRESAGAGHAEPKDKKSDKT